MGGKSREHSSAKAFKTHTHTHLWETVNSWISFNLGCRLRLSGDLKEEIDQDR